jgi:hypothetical protein
MGTPFSRHDASRIYFHPAHPGSRAVFMTEVRTRKEARQVRELFEMVGQLAEVVPISCGAVTSYAVQVHGDTSLFGKVEWLLKTQFPFSLVERNFSEVTFQLVRSLCEDSDGQIDDLPECGICGCADPFPTRATIEWTQESEPLHLSYCNRCAAQHADQDLGRFAHALLRKDTHKLRIGQDVPVMPMPEMERHDGVEILAATG